MNMTIIFFIVLLVVGSSAGLALWLIWKDANDEPLTEPEWKRYCEIKTRLLKDIEND